MKSNRELCIAECFKWEGGYSNDANDSGGPTNWGITIADARKFWKASATPADVKAMPKSVAYDIYTKKYWKTPYYDCDNLASGVDLAVFDFGVNSGPSRAKRYLDASVGGTSEETVNKICDARLAFMRAAKNSKTGKPLWPTFGKGWARRVGGIRTKSIELTKKKNDNKDIVAGGAGGAAGGAVATYTCWDWIVAHPKTSVLVALGVANLIGLIIWAFRKGKDADKIPAPNTEKVKNVKLG